MRNYRDAKLLAQSLRHALLDKKNVYLGHSESLEIVSKMFGVRDWNTLAAKITEKNTKSDLKEAASEKDKADNHECCFHAEGVHRFEGFYKEKSHSVMKVYVVKNKIFGQMTGQIPVEIFQKDEFSFEATRYGIRVRFCCDKNKVINGFILEQNGKRSFWQSITQKEALTIESALKKRIEESLATPGSEKALHDLILCIYSNKIDFNAVEENLARALKEQLSYLNDMLKKSGKLANIRFIGVHDEGQDIFHAEHRRRTFRWHISLAPDSGKISFAMVDTVN